MASDGTGTNQPDELTSFTFARGQQRALELIATGAPLTDVLSFIVRVIEEHAPGMRGSVLLLPDGIHVRHGAAPSLPAGYTRLVDGLAIGPAAGSCGTAMYEDRRVIVSDIEHDPLWDRYRELALPFGLRACWSTPLHASSGRVIGSFAMYYDAVHVPSRREIALADVASHLSGIAVEHTWSAEQLSARANEQAAVATIGQQALTGGDDHALMKTVVTRVSETLSGAPVALFEVTGGDGYRLRAERGWPDGLKPIVDAITVDVPGPDGDRWGVLAVVARDGHVVDEAEITFLRSVVNVLAASLERSRSERDMRHQALHDPLTGLPNRALLLSLLEHALLRERRAGGTLAVLLVDLDNFKLINDTLGHEAGDQLLAALAPRLRRAVRGADTVARFGGDEFVVVAEEVEDEREAAALAERLTEELAPPFHLAGREHSVTASIGVRLSSAGDGSPEALLRDADLAMYRAKERGGDGHRVFDAGMRERAVSRLRLVGALREALSRQELEVHYQRIARIADNRTVGSEALLRWRRPPEQATETSEVIAAAETYGLINTLGTWALEEALASASGALEAPDAGRALAAGAGGLPADEPPWLSVNISARQIASEGFPAVVERALGRAGWAPERLVLEITETALLDESGYSTANVTALAGLGVMIALDDFGTGFSSLRHLLRFPINVLKIDRSFVAGLPENRQARAIIAAVAVMAHELGKLVVAEGVETAAQLESAAELGCDFAQGYLIGRPGPGSPPTALERAESARPPGSSAEAT